MDVMGLNGYFLIFKMVNINLKLENYRKKEILLPLKVFGWIIRLLAHQTEIATLFAWVIKLHLTQASKINQNLEINQILGVVVQEKESNVVFCSRWKFPTIGMTMLSGTSAEPRFRSARSSLGLETSI